MYSPLVLEYFEKSENVGELPVATASSRVQNPGCGDILELSLLIDKQVILDARFRAKGCVASIACASRLTEMIRGQKVSEALNIRSDALIASLGGLPPASHHAAHLSVDGLRTALRSRPNGQ